MKRHRTPLQGWRSAVSDPRRTARVQLGLSGTTEVAGCCIIADNRVGTDRLALALGQREKGRRRELWLGDKVLGLFWLGLAWLGLAWLGSDHG